MTKLDETVGIATILTMVKKINQSRMKKFKVFNLFVVIVFMDCWEIVNKLSLELQLKLNL